MSFLDYLFDSEYGQRKDINTQRDELHSLGGRQQQDRTELRQRIYQLEAENDEIKQFCLAILRTLSDHGLITESVFAQQLVRARTAKDPQAWRRVCPEIELPVTTRRYTKRNVDFTDIAKASEEMTQHEDRS